MFDLTLGQTMRAVPIY